MVCGGMLHLEGFDMPFIKVPGLEGKVYVPVQDLKAPKKHPCADCFSCQMCTDDRCEICRGKTSEGCANNGFCKSKNRSGNE